MGFGGKFAAGFWTGVEGNASSWTRARKEENGGYKDEETQSIELEGNATAGFSYVCFSLEREQWIGLRGPPSF